MTDLAHPSPTSALDVIKDQIAPGITTGELAYFGQVSNRLGLSFFQGEIVPIGRRNKTGKMIYRPQITIEGRLALARRTGDLAGIDGPVWCGPRVDGQLEWRDVWDEDAYPYCARVLVYVKGWDRPVNGTAKWSEFAQLGQGGMWEKMPSHMLGKTALSIALRRGFAGAISMEGVDTEDPDIVLPAETPPTEEDPFTVRGQPRVDVTVRHQLLAQAEALPPDEAQWLKREWLYQVSENGPRLSSDQPMTRAEGELYRRLLDDARFFTTGRPELNPRSWAPDPEAIPDDVYDRQPEATQHGTDDPTRYDPAD